jgi:cytochrome c
MRRSTVLALPLGLMLAAGASFEATGQEPSIARGQALAERHCARCHAVTRTGQSRDKQAPPFRELPKRYPVENLAEALAEGIVVGHNDMPEFLFDPPDIEALLAYIASLAP